MIIEAVERLFARAGDLDGLQVVVSAGGTREPIDPVRFIGNRSSGKMAWRSPKVPRPRGRHVDRGRQSVPRHAASTWSTQLRGEHAPGGAARCILRGCAGHGGGGCRFRTQAGQQPQGSSATAATCGSIWSRTPTSSPSRRDAATRVRSWSFAAESKPEANALSKLLTRGST
jgi:hypothetical protein